MRCQQDDFFETTQNGFRKASSLGGTLTGYGADIIIIDDPQKAQEILSEKIRKSSNEIFSNTIISRLNNKVEGKIVVVAQRLHMEDFSDYVQKYGKWEVLAIPAIAETNETYILSNDKVIERKIGDVINPELEPLEKLEEIRNGMGEFNFSAQYQQTPIPVLITRFRDIQKRLKNIMKKRNKHPHSNFVNKQEYDRDSLNLSGNPCYEKKLLITGALFISFQ